MEMIEQLDDLEVPISRSCEALGVSRASLYRRTARPRPHSLVPRPPSHRRIPNEERQRVVEVLNSEEFVDQPPREVYAALLSMGLYLVSVRTMYRILAERGEARERRAQRLARTHAVPRVTATAPNQVWTWDITKLATTSKGAFLSLYVIMDLFSRYVVGWMVASEESQHLARQLFDETIARHGLEPGQVVVHSDRGSPMRSDTLAQLFAVLGVKRSFSRPRVSNDNPFSEAQFKTLKYQPDYPGRFVSVLDARGWLQDFFTWHNDAHHHAGLALFTPADVFFNRVEDIAASRQRALDVAYAAHPERFVSGPPTVRRPPAVVAINPVDPQGLGGDGESLPLDVTSSIAPAETPPSEPSLARREMNESHSQQAPACT